RLNHPTFADLVGDLTGRPMADGPPGICWVFTRHRYNLDDLFRSKGRGCARAWVIGQGLLDHGDEYFVTAPVSFNLLELGGKGKPALMPRTYRSAIEVHLMRHIALRSSRLQCQQNLGAAHQTLGTGLTARNLLQTGLLSRGQLHPRRYSGGRQSGSGHTSILWEELGRFWLL